MSQSLKKTIQKYGYEYGYEKYKIDHPKSIKRIENNIEKYGFEKGIDKTIEENTAKYSNTKERFIKLYGEREGIIKWENFINSKKTNNNRKYSKPTIEKYIKKYGEENGKILWNKYKKSLSFTKKYCIEKYGKEEGEKKWNEYVDKMSKSCKESTSSEQMSYINSIHFYIEKYGKEEGEKKYEEWKKSQDHSSISFMVKKYGIDEGLKKYKEVSFKRSFHSDSYHSKISQSLFENIKNIINDDTCKYSTNGGELRLYDEKENKPYYYDFSYKNKIIEYNGDFWHANPNFYESDYIFKNGIYASDIWEKDKKKQLLAKEKGYEILTIWDSEYKKDSTNVLKKCLSFLIN